MVQDRQKLSPIISLLRPFEARYPQKSDPWFLATLFFNCARAFSNYKITHDNTIIQLSTTHK